MKTTPHDSSREGRWMRRVAVVFLVTTGFVLLDVVFTAVLRVIRHVLR